MLFDTSGRSQRQKIIISDKFRACSGLQRSKTEVMGRKPTSFLYFFFSHFSVVEGLGLTDLSPLYDGLISVVYFILTGD